MVNEGNGREANKLIFHDGYYYLVFSEHRDGIGRYVMAKRDRKMTGQFSEERQLLLPCREANEPNQGGIIEGPDGKRYFFTHHGSGDWSGRIASLLPVEWIDGWPIMGDTRSGEPGTMVWQAPMPVGINEELEAKSEELSLQRSDDFDSETLGPWWQWNYQPRENCFSLTARPGWLRLKAFRPIETNKLLKAGNTLTQRSFRSQYNEVTVKLDLSHLSEGQHAGLCHFAEHSGCLGIVKENGQVRLELRHDDQCEDGPHISGTSLWLRSEWGLDGLSRFSYSIDGDRFTPFGDYRLSWGFYRGDRIGIYCFNDLEDSGFVDIDYLHYTIQP